MCDELFVSEEEQEMTENKIQDMTSTWATAEDRDDDVQDDTILQLVEEFKSNSNKMQNSNNADQSKSEAESENESEWAAADGQGIM